MDRSTIVYEGAIDKLTDKGVRSILSRSIRGLSLTALASARYGPTCGPRTHGYNSSLCIYVSKKRAKLCLSLRTATRAFSEYGSSRSYGDRP
jgi:hypothetical protein